MGEIPTSGWRLPRGPRLAPRALHPVTGPVLSLGLLLGLGLLYPAVLVLIAAVVAAVQACLNLLPWLARHLHAPSTDADGAAAAARPIWFSVHVPVHNEPPDIVIRCLDALARQQDAPPHEVIVLDNNTPDPALWRPVRDWCRARGRPFRFIHRQNLRGAKAGALNIALAEADSQSTHVVVIDADYRATPDFLRVAAMALRASGASFLQFPQSFEARDADAQGLAIELADYFRRPARLADQGRAMLLTGTLSVLSRPALASIGGWSARTSTEDADTGLRLLQAGFAGRYVDRIVGHGLMAFDLDALKMQRSRWAQGNARTLMLMLQSEMRARRLSAGQICLIALQLTAWTNLSLPAVVLTGIAPLLWIDGHHAKAQAVAALALLTLVLALYGGLVPFVTALRHGGLSPRSLRVAVMTRLALHPASSIATIKGLLPLPQLFLRTPKCHTAPPVQNSRWAMIGLTALLAALMPLLHGMAAIFLGSFVILLFLSLCTWSAAVAGDAIRHYALREALG